MKRRFWTQEEDEIMRKEYPNEWSEVIADKLNRTVRSVYSRANTLGLHKSVEFQKVMKEYYSEHIKEVGKTTRFRKGLIPTNKGKKIEEYMSPEAIAKVRKTTFKKGHVPANHKPIGHQRITKEGYIEMKVEEPNVFELLHRWLWVKYNGPIPKGTIITFINGDKKDVRIDNLQMLSMKDNMKRNTIQRYPEELKEMIRLTGKLNRKIVARGKVGKGKSY